MKAFRKPMQEMEVFQEIAAALQRRTGLIHVSGCIDAQKAHLIDCLSASNRIRVIVAANDLRGREIYDNYRLFDRDVLYFPARDVIFFQADVHSNVLEQQRIALYKALAEHQQVSVVTTITALMNHLMPFAVWKKQIRTLAVGDELDLDAWKHRLVEMGYERNAQVEGPGQFAARGSILDIFPLTEEVPVRIDLFGDEIDSIRCFDVSTQRSIEEMDGVTIYPASELILDEERRSSGLSRIRKEAERAKKAFRKTMDTEAAYHVSLLEKDAADQLENFLDPAGLDSYLQYFYPETQSLIDFFEGQDAVFFLDEPGRLTEAADAAVTEFSDSMRHRLEKGYALPGQTNLLYSISEVAARLEEQHAAALSILDSLHGGWHVAEHFQIQTAAMSPYNNSFELLLKDLKRWKKEKYRVILLSASRTRGQRLAGQLREEDLNAVYSEDPERDIQPGELLITYGSAHRGYQYPLIKFIVIADSDIFGREKKKKKRKKSSYDGKHIASFQDLAPGDYVVHENHGLGIYRGIEKIEVDGIIKDYMKIEYDKGGNLYVLPSQLDVIQKYADASAKKPKLNKLGGTEWKKTKVKVKTAVDEIAQELVELYAIRENKEGYRFGEDTVWQREFEEMFPFEETEDQLTAIEATKRDMESSKIMDRLICGDVGYGKTEIAIRAAFKAIQEGKQVVYLVPTTILAQQHYNTFVQRMKDFPVRVDMMSRFRTPAQIKKTIADLKRGVVDIVIGTHKVLSKEVAFKDLGLLIIDEEQRFGVTHKEKIKQLKKDIDVLTLTATPIPRTLHMSLIGIRDMSVLEEAPMDRQPVQTYVMEYNEEMVREAISRELARDGQVYYVYNRVNTIADMAGKLQQLLPEARVVYAHGQMKERELEDIMVDFVNGEIDVLVSTTIIETGLDIANANTMIIHDADNMGLSQLYQLRGRIGRSSRTAYAFLMYKRDKMLKEVAEKRLAAIREFTELGSGFKIAMRDLEIRGAGNLLGAAQSGHMAAVGYDLYCKLLHESVQTLTGSGDERNHFDTAIDLDVDAFIPDYYIPNEEQKLDIYKRIAQIAGQDDYDDMLEELLDRFHEPPKSVMNLLMIAMLKAQAHTLYLTEIKQRGQEIRFGLYEHADLKLENLRLVLQALNGRLIMNLNNGIPVFTYRRLRGDKNLDALAAVKEVLEAMSIMSV